jgi:hypothetical protein
LIHVFAKSKFIYKSYNYPEVVQYFQAFSLEEAQQLIKENPENFAPSFRVHFKRFIKKLKKFMNNSNL